MSGRFNTNMAKALGADLPEEEQPDTIRAVVPVPVEPHEMPKRVVNPALPDMSDIDIRLTEGEKQLESVIGLGQKIIMELYADIPNIAANLRRGQIEQIALLYSHISAAVNNKVKLQLEKYKIRLEQAEFGGNKTDGTGEPLAIGTNGYVGKREEVLAMLAKEAAQTDPDTPEEDVSS